MAEVGRSRWSGSRLGFAALKLSQPRVIARARAGEAVTGAMCQIAAGDGVAVVFADSAARRKLVTSAAPAGACLEYPAGMASARHSRMRVKTAQRSPMFKMARIETLQVSS